MVMLFPDRLKRQPSTTGKYLRNVDVDAVRLVRFAVQLLKVKVLAAPPLMYTASVHAPENVQELTVQPVKADCRSRTISMVFIKLQPVIVVLLLVLPPFIADFAPVSKSKARPLIVKPVVPDREKMFVEASATVKVAIPLLSALNVTLSAGVNVFSVSRTYDPSRNSTM